MSPESSHFFGSNLTMVHKIIRQLVSIPGLRIECPSCGEEFSIRKARLFNMYDKYPSAVQKIIRERLGYANELKAELKERKKSLAESKKKKPEKIAVAAQASNFGQISEQIIPAFLTFPYKQNECRILFKPIDYIVFTGLSGKRHVETIRFVDVKTGDGRLTTGQRQIRDRVVEGRIKHTTISQ
jgi:predicted Holliday junction resolvase-like endonuclease